MTKLFGRAKKICSALVVAMAVGTMAPPAFAFGRIVYDPTNWAQNLITARNAVMTEANTYSTMIESTRQTAAMIKSVSSIGGLSQLAGVGEELALFQELSSNALQLYSIMGQAQQLYTDLQSQYSASGFTWQNFLANRAGNTMVRADNMMAQFQTVNQSLQRVSQRRTALLQKAQEAGVNESMMQVTQVVSGQLDMIAGQNQQVISMMANKTAEEATDKSERAKAEQAAQEMNRQYQNRVRQSAEALH